MKTLLLLAFWCFTTMFCTAQLKIMDLSVYPAIEMDTVTQAPIDTNNITYNLDFKVNNIAGVANVNILFGTSINSGDILNSQLSVLNQGGQYFIQNNGINFPVNGYQAAIKISLTKLQEAAFDFITIYMTDNQSTETNRLYFNR